MNRQRVMLVDDHALLRGTLRLLLNAQPDFQVVAEANGSSDAVGQLRDPDTLVDLVCVDLSFPKEPRGQIVRHVLRECPRMRLLVLTMHDDPATARAACALGALGYVLKSSNPTVFLAGLRAVSCGENYIDPALRGELTPDQPRSTAHARAANTSPRNLSEREEQILTLLALGRSHRQIADELFLSNKTIETYRTRLGKKLGFHSRADLVQFALAAGLIHDASLVEDTAV